MLLTGTFARSVDDKLRLALPKRLRQALGCPEGGVLFVAPGTDGSLAIYPQEAFLRWGDRLKEAPPTQKDVRAFTRLFYAQAQQVELDRHGRIRIPAELATLARLGKEVVLLGVQDHLELWAAERWREYLVQQQARFDEVAEAAFGSTHRSSSAADSSGN